MYLNITGTNNIVIVSIYIRRIQTFSIGTTNMYLLVMVPRAINKKCLSNVVLKAYSTIKKYIY